MSVGDQRVFDADSHFMEPPDLWAEHIDPLFAGREPVGSTDRGATVVDGDRRVPTVRWRSRAGGLATLNEEWATTYRRYDERHWDPDAYVLAMDDQGIDRMALYPSRGLMQVAAWGLDPHLTAGIVRAYNTWASKFVSHVPDRLSAVGQLALNDVDAAIVEARRCVDELGVRAFFVLPEPPLPGVTLERTYYDPLWATLAELGTPLALHNVAGTGLGQIGADRFGQWALPRIAAAFPLEAQLTLFSFLVGGICDRHPDLRVVVLEAGAGWVPFWLWWLDELYERYEGLDCDSLSATPGELFRRQCFVSAEIEEPNLRQVVDALGVDCIVTASDFPHPEGSFPDGVRDFVARDDLSDAEKQAILWDNPHRLYEGGSP
ncbi:MAG TPA: amidohydrolase family protein [Acidimicrobiia bacterium]|nr:amidohydrolase family protein [Acidimicrobiia bacterium]